MTRQDYRCPSCFRVEEKRVRLGHSLHLHCPSCGALMTRYFGRTRDLTINYGFRPSRYPDTESERIAQFQFENL